MQSPLDITRTMRMHYRSTTTSKLMIHSFQELFDKTAPDFTPVYERVALPEIAANASLAGEAFIHR